MKRIHFLLLFLLVQLSLRAQFNRGVQWTEDGNGYRRIENKEIIQYSLPDLQKTVLISAKQLTPAGKSEPLTVRSYEFSEDGRKALIYTNTARVWRYDTRGDYWVLDLDKNTLTQVGKGRPVSSLMFAKFSPDGKKVAYVSERNIFAEDLATGKITPLTKDGTTRLINGTFDWVYEEEFDCRDGFRWSPDSRNIAYWQIDATKIRNFLMINNTDSTYAFNVPVEYPKVGERPSPYKIGVVSASGGATKWMSTPGDPGNTYIPRMEWANANELVLQQLNRKQNQAKCLYADVKTGRTTEFYADSDDAWVETKSSYSWADSPAGWDWLNGGKEFLWMSEKDGWRHLYRVSRDGKTEKCLTVGDYDVIGIVRIDEKNNYAYFMASPDNATQTYLFRVKLDGSGKAERMSPASQVGSHRYDISPNGAWASHSFSNANTAPMNEWLRLPDHKALKESDDITAKLAAQTSAKKKVEFFRIKTEDGTELDGWMVKPDDFDPTKKYPIVFSVYGEPASSTVMDRWGTGRNGLYIGDMAKDGYIYASVDNRGTPSPKGRAWRKAIYRKIGNVNIRDLAMGAKTLFAQNAFIDTSRVAVHGWSGGGSSTLNLLFQYPDLFKTGIAVAAVADQLSYDNIYQERYMGIPQENREDFVSGSPLSHAKNLRPTQNLLYIHGTGDDNVHYQNAEKLVNELIKYNKQFQFMAYPNRSHGIYEGEGTSRHLNTLFTKFLKEHCPPGAK
ncbi:prolyl oligopeptidase family serine peptidase [Runella sp. CRIBMP]|uniref:S9 family peptidase n=1 Tax=Runella sp. CRIBMP TaxID=2683261 RepID=UPI00141362E9|nr:S9 family peptidase [Runella sp. CRIBMP]NBB20662.1 prolyl oligopeptidase family serine peptidase [Runella sp. CRIBMP]